MTTLVHDASQSLIEFARWPDTEARRIAVDGAVADLRAALHGFDPIVPRAIMLTLIAELLESMFVRECPVRGIRLAFDKMIDIFDPAKDKAGNRKPRDAEARHDDAKL